MVNGVLTKLFTPFTYVPSMGAPSSTYRDKSLAIDRELMAWRSFLLSELPAKIYHKTAEVLTLKPEHMSAHFVANPTATSVFPFDTADETKDEMERIRSRKSTYLPHSLGLIMIPEEGLTVAYFWITVFPVIVSEGLQAEHQHLIQYFQVAAMLRSTGGALVVNHNPFQVVNRDEGVFETVEQCILDCLFPSSNGSLLSMDGSGFSAVAKEIGALAASNQQQAEEAEERRLKWEAEKYSLEKILGRNALERLKKYNGVRANTSDERLVSKGIPLCKKLANVQSTKDTDVLKAIQEALEDVFAAKGVDPEDAFKATPQMMKALMEPWERIDTDSLVTGVGANLFLLGPKCALTAEEQIQVYHATMAATNAPDAEALKKLYSGDTYVPTIADVGYTLRSMMWCMMVVTVPGHIMSLRKVITKWTGIERNFTLNALGDQDPQRGIYLLEALNMLMNDYWIDQRKSDELIPGWDGLQIFRDIKAKKPWRPEFTPQYKEQLKLNLFVGVYGSHRIMSDGGNKAQVIVLSAAAPSTTPKESRIKQVDEDKRQTDTSAVTNESYPKQGMNLFGCFKKRRDPGTGREYLAKRVRDKATKPLPDSKSGSGQMCLAYHCKGLCNAKCPRAADHIHYTDKQYQPLITWCEECYPGSDM
jgi:hypothetical protein